MVLGTEMEPHSRSVRPLQDKEERDLVKKKKSFLMGIKTCISHIFCILK